MKTVLGLFVAIALAACGAPEANSIDVLIVHDQTGVTVSGGDAPPIDIQILGGIRDRNVDLNEMFQLEVRNVPDWVTVSIEPMVVNRGTVQLKLKIAQDVHDGGEALLQICASTLSKQTSACSMLPILFHAAP
jgi:hypothetical protein